MGSKPGAILTALTKAHLEQCEKLNLPTDAHPAGGIIGVPTLRQIQHKVYELKKRKIAGFQVGNIMELRDFMAGVSDIGSFPAEVLLAKSANVADATLSQLTIKKLRKV